MSSELFGASAGLTGMRCDEAREALSARLDGEPTDDAAVNRHLSSCAECPDWLSAAHAVTRRTRLSVAPQVPDLTDRIVAAVQSDRQQQVSGRKTVAQVALLVVAALQLLLALPSLLGGHDHEAPLHVAHEMGSFNVALAVAYLIAGLQPFRAGGLLPFAGVAAGLLTVTASIDLVRHETSATEELPHLLAIVGFLLLWRLLDRSHHKSSAGLRQQVRPAAGRMLQEVREARLVRTVRSRRVLAVLVGAAVVVPLLAGPAEAHAVLESSDPASGVVLTQPGDAVTLHFDESVTLLPSGIRVLDGNGKRVDRGNAAHPGNSQDVRVGLRDKLPNGSYLVDWRVVSADSHPIAGAFTFSVGAPGQKVASAGAGGGDRTVGLLLGFSRLLTFIALALLVGAGAFLVMCWQAGRRRRGMRRVLFGSCAAAGVAAVAGLLLQGPYAAGLSLGDAFDPQLLRTISASPYGHALYARLGLLALAGGWLVLFFRAGARISRPVVVGGGVLGFGVLATLPLGGHANAGSQRPLALLADTSHLVAMSVWLGGLVVLAGLLVRPDRRVDLPGVVGRFSRIAFAAVLVLVGTGIYASVRQVGSLLALLSSPYGHLLLIKINLVLLVVGVAAMSRSWTRRHRPAQVSAAELDELVQAGERELALAGGGGAGRNSRGSAAEAAVPRQRADGKGAAQGKKTGDTPDPLELRSLRRSVLAEVVIAIGILAVTAVLVVTQPAKVAAPSAARPAASSTTTTRVAAGPVTVLVSSFPAGPRQLNIRLSTFSNGRLQSVPELTGALRLPAQGLGPLPVTFRPNGPGQFVADAVNVPVAGEWNLALSVRVTDFDAYPVQTTLAVR
ncbi:MAG: copper transport protein [Frankiaceae bacterium]|nr:copper transport protein [Frankiaceae bacterium]